MVGRETTCKDIHMRPPSANKGSSLSKRIAMGSAGSVMATNPVSATRWKLEEARFFLRKVRRHYHDRVHANLGSRRRARPDFEFYLSAFLSAARSVPWVMKAEYGRVPEWSQWYEAYKPSADDIELLKRFNELRVKSEKVGQPSLGLLLRFEGTRAAQDRRRDRRLPNFEVSLFGEDRHGKPRVLARGRVHSHDWLLEGFDSQPLPEAAGRYLRLLDALVVECEQRFGEPTFSQTAASDIWGKRRRHRKGAKPRTGVRR
jgi:hypothetical protein